MTMHFMRRSDIDSRVEQLADRLGLTAANARPRPSGGRLRCLRNASFMIGRAGQPLRQRLTVTSTRAPVCVSVSPTWATMIDRCRRLCNAPSMTISGCRNDCPRQFSGPDHPFEGRRSASFRSRDRRGLRRHGAGGHGCRASRRCRQDSRLLSTVREFPEETFIAIEPLDAEQADIAGNAYGRYGKGHHRAGLNLGDVFSYALARKRGLPLLFKGDDFTYTDIEPA